MKRIQSSSPLPITTIAIRSATTLGRSPRNAARRADPDWVEWLGAGIRREYYCTLKSPTQSDYGTRGRERTMTSAVSMLALFLAARLARLPEENAWIPLFNGKDLSGWHLRKPDGPNLWC